jgi:hypothetical protein
VAHGDADHGREAERDHGEPARGIADIGREADAGRARRAEFVHGPHQRVGQPLVHLALRARQPDRRFQIPQRGQRHRRAPRIARQAPLLLDHRLEIGAERRQQPLRLGMEPRRDVQDAGAGRALGRRRAIRRGVVAPGMGGVEGEEQREEAGGRREIRRDHGLRPQRREQRQAGHEQLRQRGQHRRAGEAGRHDHPGVVIEPGMDHCRNALHLAATRLIAIGAPGEQSGEPAWGPAVPLSACASPSS